MLYSCNSTQASNYKFKKFPWFGRKNNKRNCEKRPFLVSGRQDLYTNVWVGFTGIGGTNENNEKQHRGAHFSIKLSGGLSGGRLLRHPWNRIGVA